MNNRRTPRLIALSAIVGASLVGGLLTAEAGSAAAGSCGRVEGCTKFELIHAGGTYDWWPEARRYEFKSADGPVPPAVFKLTGKPEVWASGKPTAGTLGVKVDTDGGDVYTDWTEAWVNGRWEVRFRSLSQRDPGSSEVPTWDSEGKRSMLSPGIDANIRFDLVPAGTAAMRCSPTAVTVVAYNPAVRRTAHIGVTAPDASYAGTVTPWSQVSDLDQWRKWSGPVNSPQSAWHVWAVELRPTKITWFMDGKVTKQAPRPASTKTTAFTMRESILGSLDPAIHTAYANTQLDWARYWTLKHLTKKRKLRKKLKRAPLLAATAPATPVGPC